MKKFGLALLAIILVGPVFICVVLSAILEAMSQGLHWLAEGMANWFNRMEAKVYPPKNTQHDNKQAIRNWDTDSQPGGPFERRP